jgi:diguanylate cyclase (GGDEF)-like protein
MRSGIVRAQRTEEARAPSAPTNRTPRSEVELTYIRCLGAVALLCSRDDVDIKAIFSELVNLIPAAKVGLTAGTCRLEFMGTSFWSAGYREHLTRHDLALSFGGTQVGSIVIGGWDDADSQASGTGPEEFLTTIVNLINQMLARRMDRQQVRELRAELDRRQAALEQIRRLGKLGVWDFVAKSSVFTWSEEARLIAGLHLDEPTRPQREELMGAFLLKAIQEAVRTRKQVDQEIPCVQPDGTKRWLHVLGEVEVADAQLAGAHGIIRDVTEEKERQSRLSRLANHDPLTGLANRRGLLEKFETILLKQGTAGALLLTDLDNFKDVNDAGGHDAGDALLKAFARRLEEAAGRAGFVARLGGDEFVVLFPSNADRSALERWARSLQKQLQEPLAVAGHGMSIRLSAGLTIFPADGNGAAELLKNADLAVYAAKARGRNTLVTYDSSLRQESQRRVALCSEVKEALSTDRIVPFYQPKICLSTGRLEGFEALLRWQHPSGLRAPGTMLPAFDVPELSRALCSRMLKAVVGDLARWGQHNLPYGRVAFNASSSEFSGFDLVRRVLGELGAAAVPPSCLGLEVTETVFLGGGSGAIGPILEQLHKAGVEIALDDFGTGYASLTHLQEYPVDIIKIDQSFIRGLTTDSASQAITSVVLGLGRSLGMKVVAEGVETAEQAAYLKAAGCDQVQGYFFARPMPAGDVPDFVTSWRGVVELAGLDVHPGGAELLIRAA